MRRKGKKIVAIAVFLTLLFQVASARDNDDWQTLSLRVDPQNAPGRVSFYSFAIDSYKSKPKLYKAVSGAKAFKQSFSNKFMLDSISESYNTDASKSAIARQLEKIQKESKSSDSIILYFAGYSAWDERGGRNFFLPQDAGVDANDQDRWLSYDYIMSCLNRAPARHILVIFDTEFNQEELRPTEPIPMDSVNAFQLAFLTKSRQVIVSGKSPDKSEFAAQFDKSISGLVGPLEDCRVIAAGLKSIKVAYSQPVNYGNIEGGSLILAFRDSISWEGFFDNLENYSMPFSGVESRIRVGDLIVETTLAGALYIDGTFVRNILPGDVVTVKGLRIGSHAIELRGSTNSAYGTGFVEEGKARSVLIGVAEDSTGTSFGVTGAEEELSAYAKDIIANLKPGMKVKAIATYERILLGWTGTYMGRAKYGYPDACVVWDNLSDASPAKDVLPQGISDAQAKQVYFIPWDSLAIVK